MKASDILESRRQNWQELERLCNSLEPGARNSPVSFWTGIFFFINPLRVAIRVCIRSLFALAPSAEERRVRGSAAEIARFAALYRAACADLALADAYQLPPNTVQYLHRLVGRAHNQLYRGRRFDFSRWGKVLIEDVPQQIFRDPCVHVAFALFWGMFLLAMALAYNNVEFARALVGEGQLEMMEAMHGNTVGTSAPIGSPAMAGFYIQHNTSIGLQCFVGGLFVLPGIAVTLFNAGFLGAVFGYMARPEVDASGNFFHFVTAHGPFELTAIVLSAGAGLRLGMSWLSGDERRLVASTDDAEREGDLALSIGSLVASGLSFVSLRRTAAMEVAAREAMPVMGAAMIMFLLAAFIEGFLSPSALPYWTKATVAVGSSILLTFYFIVLGFPRSRT